jgi:hypothetical protein
MAVAEAAGAGGVAGLYGIAAIVPRFAPELVAAEVEGVVAALATFAATSGVKTGASVLG